MTDENQKPDQRKGPWQCMLMFVLALGVAGTILVVLFGGVLHKP
ncbi:hypothetical protein [Hyphomicrobium sp. GJ21]|nr:hypothetical protein [Hyphomicrobium sp. GJ21]